MFFVIFAFIENCFACHWLFNGKGLFRRRTERSVSDLKGNKFTDLAFGFHIHILCVWQNVWVLSLAKSDKYNTNFETHYDCIVIIADEALAELTLHAFEKCDVDGVYGISWKEVMECEEEFCEKLNILCPTQQEFQSFDQNEDGSLTLEEYFDQM